MNPLSQASDDRIELLAFLAEADERTIQAVRTLLHADLQASRAAVEEGGLSQEQLEELERRQADYRAGKGETSPWRDVLNSVRSAYRG